MSTKWYGFKEGPEKRQPRLLWVSLSGLTDLHGGLKSGLLHLLRCAMVGSDFCDVVHEGYDHYTV